eukprot:TRINITY_DN8793_c0_g1_i4.p1 TRINITY_DN8793_c0_g1~~TRINITY_DN8793_c0_g1_i4.p1  ORF type:complete len:740 (-),score=203.63 TRINITY_DN8793_c0_g1_i4:416-2635(-)
MSADAWAAAAVAAPLPARMVSPSPSFSLAVSRLPGSATAAPMPSTAAFAHAGGSFVAPGFAYAPLGASAGYPAAGFAVRTPYYPGSPRTSVEGHARPVGRTASPMQVMRQTDPAAGRTSSPIRLVAMPADGASERTASPPRAFMLAPGTQYLGGAGTHIGVGATAAGGVPALGSPLIGTPGGSMLMSTLSAPSQMEARMLQAGRTFRTECDAGGKKDRTVDDLRRELQRMTALLAERERELAQIRSSSKSKRAAPAPPRPSPRSGPAPADDTMSIASADMDYIDRRIHAYFLQRPDFPLEIEKLRTNVYFLGKPIGKKVARVSGERTVEEREEFNKKEQKSLHAILTAQIKRQDAELKHAKRGLTDIHKETTNMKSTMEELELQNTIVNRTVSQTVKEKEEALMQHDILRLELKRLRQNLNTKSETLYSLENRKQQLQISMEEREKEVEVHTDVLKTQLRAAEDERHKAAIELAERKQKIYNLKMKYENVMSKVKKAEGAEGELSQAAYVIKAAQEKEELQRKGDELDDKIRRAEREIRALENTLGHLVTRNQKFKENFQTANQQNQSELEEKQMLEEQSRAANEVLFKKKKVLGQMDRELKEDTKRYEEVRSNLEGLDSHVTELGAAQQMVSQELEAQTGKMERASQALEMSKSRAGEVGVDLAPESAASVEIEARNLGDQNTSVVYALNNSLQDYYAEDVLPLFESLCDEKQIHRPSRAPSVASSRPASRDSSQGGV